jgi:hypothetical protein
MPPMRRLPDKPVLASVSCGTAHSGARRGKSMNSTTMIGAPSSAALAATAPARASDGRPTGMCASTSAASRPQTDTSMAAATASVCE